MLQCTQSGVTQPGAKVDFWETWVRRGARLAAFGTLFALTVLSLLPGELRPHVADDGNIEHFLAYLAAGLLLPIGLPRLRAWRTPLLLVMLAALFEAAQLYIPHRGPGLDNWLTSAAGAGLAAVLTALVQARGVRAVPASVRSRSDPRGIGGRGG